MIAQSWVLGATGLLIGVYLLVIYYVYRRKTSGVDRAGERPAGSGEDVVDCRSCGAENEASYRFCRRCVSELPGGPTVRRDGGGIGSRGLS